MNERMLFRILRQSENSERETVSSLNMDRMQTSVSLASTLCLELLLDSSSHGKPKSSCLIGRSPRHIFKCTHTTPRAVQGGSLQSDRSTFLSLSVSLLSPHLQGLYSLVTLSFPSSHHLFHARAFLF